MNKYTRVMLLVVVFISISLVAQAGSLVPGSADDPIVTKSYVDERINALRSELAGSSKSASNKQDATANNNTQAASSTGSPSSGTSDGGSSTVTTAQFKYTVVKLKKGQKLLGGDGTEMIVRTGKAVAIGNDGGNGLPDVTAGIDVKDGQEVGLNHLLLVPSKDGRGILITGDADAYVMVRGAFEIR